ncbi:hypothetical protein BC835DRAFT_1304043 [Cytidiella melzeri]|nr:hypothetical protein BC835DRAFT_1304043 [Cytidiella melzeri]
MLQPLVLSLATTLFLLGSVRATNDWSVPCLSGRCSYDLKNNTASGSLFISGSSKAISDITTAAGWAILDCNATAMNQDIRAVCTGNTTACSQLYSGGAAGTIVRLPENCGKMPFARIAKEWKHQNQTIPSQIKEKMQKRDDDPNVSTVRGMSLDTNFAAVDPSQNGNVSLFIQGSNADGANGDFTVTPPDRRGFFGDIADDVEDAAGDAVDAVGDAAGNVANDVSGLVDDALNDLYFNVSKSDSQTVDVDQPFTLFDQSIDCPASGDLPALKGEVKVGKIAVDAKAHAVIGYGVIAAGTIVPPQLSNFGLFATLDGSLNGVLTVNASATATLDSGKIQVFQVGIPGLDFPGVLSIGPSFVVNAQGIATLDTELNMAVDLAYNINGAKLFFPPDTGSSGGDFVPASTGLSLAATPNAAASGSVEAHIIPTIEFGINALDGLAQANINLDLDSSAKLTLSLDAGATASESTSTASTDPPSYYMNSYDDSSSSSSDSYYASRSTSTSDSFSGCVDVSTGLAVNAGADGSFFDLFDKSTSVSLFQKNFDLFNKCFGSGSSKKRMYRRHPRDILAKRALTCSASGADTTSLSSIVDDVISGDSITAE